MSLLITDCMPVTYPSQDKKHKHGGENGSYYDAHDHSGSKVPTAKKRSGNRLFVHVIAHKCNGFCRYWIEELCHSRYSTFITAFCQSRQEDGNTFDVSWISRGAREQLFIALRLALASEFARHGSVLPLILDDVLVNFDTKRAAAAIQVLRDVASAGTGRQIFLFTCHEHICRLFQQLMIPVRALPAAENG
jgi:DNA repair exonuclease SbcCD ATPase subunit